MSFWKKNKSDGANKRSEAVRPNAMIEANLKELGFGFPRET